MSRRTERVNELIRAEISNLLLREVNDPRLCGLVTVTAVSTAPDLMSARVFISIMGSDQDKKSALQGLAAATGFMRHELAQRLKLRYIPQLSFSLDESIEHGAQVLQLIKQVCPSEPPTPDPKGSR